MTVTPVHIDTTAETGALPQQTFTDVAVVGTAADAPPEAEFGEVNRYSSATDVVDDYGEDSDVHVASQNVEQMGAGEWYVLVLEETEHEDEEVDSGETLENTPALGEAGVEATGYDVVYSTDDPIDDGDVGEGELHVNTDTGELVTDDGEPATVTYSTVDWTGLDALRGQSVNRAHLADVQAGREHIGDLDEFTSWAAGADVGVTLVTRNIAEYDSDQEAMEAAHEIAGYVPNGNVIGVTAKGTSDDVGAYLLGDLAINDPWYNPYFGTEFPVSVERIDSGLIADPDTENSFLGGDDDGNGPVNVVTSVGGVITLWKSVSTAGAASDYQYFDVKMTEIFAEQLLEDAMISTRLREDRVPFTDNGKTMIGSTLRGALDQYTGGPNDPFADYDVSVPNPDDLEQDDRANRQWTDIGVEVTLTGDAHTFELDLTLTV